VSSPVSSNSGGVRLAPGTRLGSFEVLTLHGRGGMGEVYLARDLRLGRDVALKVLSRTAAVDEIAFEREARLVAALNHPNVASLYDVHETDELLCLVFELVPGQTLQERLRAGGLEMGAALTIARQIAEALNAALARGIVHRDLKPSNVMVTPDGSAKVLDFGLAKGPLGIEPADISTRPTVSLLATQSGLLVGTPSYMSPEQLRGETVDAQTDIWAFGCVLFEMLSGVRAFEGPTFSDTIAAVLHRDPEWQRLPPETPPRLRSLLERCLRRDRKLRLHHPADARIEIDEILSQAGEAAPAAAPGAAPRRRRWGLPLGLAGAAALVAASLAPGRDSAALPVARLSVNLPASAPLAAERQPVLAVSPDGQHLAYVAAGTSGRQIFTRRLDALEAAPVPGTEGGSSPAFSPDGEWIAFGSEGRLKIAPRAGGAPTILGEAPALHGLCWGPDGRIYYVPTSESGIFSISAAGGDARAVTTPDPGQGEIAHRWPHFVAESETLLFSVRRGDASGGAASRIVGLALGTGERRILADGTYPGYAAPGYLLYTRDGSLLAAPFAARRLLIRGPETLIAGEVASSPLSGAAQYAFSARGPLVYAPGGPQTIARRLLWVARDGATSPATDARRAYLGPRLSPDGRHVALGVEDDKGFDLWVQETERDALMRLSTDSGNESLAVWTPDGAKLLFRSAPAEGSTRFILKPADGSGEGRALLGAGRLRTPGSISPDGASLAYTEEDLSQGGTGADIWILPLDGTAPPEPFLRTEFDEASPMFSPDGRWVVFTSDETGRPEVYVRPFPGPGGKWQISTEGGDEARWAPDGTEIFFRSGGKMMAASVATTAEGFAAGRPSILFEDVYDAGSVGFANYDVARDGRFLMIRSEERPAPTRLSVILGWMSELGSGAPPADRTPWAQPASQAPFTGR